MKHRIGELFCGPGGLALGAAQAADEVPSATLEHAWANDYDLDTVRTYRRNVPGASETSVIHQDVRELDIESLPPIDGFTFGFPCNDFSTVGEQKGFEGKFGPLYTYGIKVLDFHNPKWFLAENVSGLMSANDGAAFETILEDLASAGRFGGYRLVPHLYQFDHYGVPQKRRRILIVGIRADQEVRFRVPSPRLYDTEETRVGIRLTVPAIAADAPNNELTRQHPKVVRRLQQIKPGQNAFNAELDEDLRLNVQGAKISQIYRRLEFDKPSYTVTGSGGGGTHVYHWEEPRALTNRERARIQTFPDNFVFEGTKDSVRKQIGMAVPVQGAKAVLTAIFRTFDNVPYDSVPASHPDVLPRANVTSLAS